MSLDFGYKQTGRSRGKKQPEYKEPDVPKVDPRMAAMGGIEAAVKATQREYDRKWGRDRLKRLVGSEMTGKFASAMERYTAARRSGNLTELEHRADVVKRGYAAMDKAAIAAGHEPLPPNVWEAVDEVGNRFVFVNDSEAIPQLSEEITAGAAVWHLGEVIKVMKFAGLDWANQIKREFGADTELKNIGKPGSIEMMDDDIPF